MAPKEGIRRPSRALAKWHGSVSMKSQKSTACVVPSLGMEKLSLSESENISLNALKEIRRALEI